MSIAILNIRYSSQFWLNMVEIELSAISRLALKNRIPSLEQLKHQVNQLIKERMAKKIKINWQFTNKIARSKFGRHYDEIILKT